MRRLSQRKSADKPREKRVAKQHVQQSRGGAMHVTGEEERRKKKKKKVVVMYRDADRT